MNDATKANLATFANATKNELFDAEYNGGEWMVEAVETAETIEQFVESSKKWNSCTKDKFGEIDGLKFVAWAEVQAKKGQPRRSLSVLDLGDIRVAIDCDLTDFV